MINNVNLLNQEIMSFVQEQTKPKLKVIKQQVSEEPVSESKEDKNT